MADPIAIPTDIVSEHAAMKAVLEAYERWEADLILDQEAWEDLADFPTLTEALWDRLMQVQAMRNDALHPGKYRRSGAAR